MKKCIIISIVFIIFGCKQNRILNRTFELQKWEIVAQTQMDKDFNHNAIVEFIPRKHICRVNNKYEFLYFANDTLLSIEGSGRKRLFRTYSSPKYLKLEELFSEHQLVIELKPN